jgi:hypothetical protein
MSIIAPPARPLCCTTPHPTLPRKGGGFSEALQRKCPPRRDRAGVNVPARIKPQKPASRKAVSAALFGADTARTVPRHAHARSRAQAPFPRQPTLRSRDAKRDRRRVAARRPDCTARCGRMAAERERSSAAHAGRRDRAARGKRKSARDRRGGRRRAGTHGPGAGLRRPSGRDGGGVRKWPLACSSASARSASPVPHR